MNEWVDAECLRSKQRAEDGYQRALRHRAWISVAASLWFLIALAWEAGNGWPSEVWWGAVSVIGAVAWLDCLVAALRELGVPWW